MIFLFAFFSLNIYFVSSTCPCTSVQYQSNCYIFNSTKTGFALAELSCRQVGGHLASVHDGFTNAVIGQEALKHLNKSAPNDLWIGATKLLSNANWNWTDGSGFDFTDWKQKEPQNVTDMNCALMSATDDYWITQDCNELNSFVCQIPLSVFNTTPTYPLNANCSLGWSYFAPTHSCYGVNAGGYVGNWTAAETHCQQSGAHLITIHSYAEYLHLLSYDFVAWSYDFWTGIYSPDSGKTWKSSDDTPPEFPDYIPWCTGHPTNISGERCVVFYMQTRESKPCYYDSDCTTQIERTLCKKRLFEDPF
uniref:C-type lectin domain-containing protein n=1 Tax=Panagrolaimus sp. ES5 TaxID=591445 RepID=A0AC34FYF3_9BILA